MSHIRDGEQTNTALSPHPVARLQWFAQPQRDQHVDFEKWLDHEMEARFKSWLMPKLRPVCDKPTNEITDEEKRIIFEQFDKFLVDQSETLGLRLFLCESVRRRLLEWDYLPNGSLYLKKFLAGMQRHVEIAHEGTPSSPTDSQEWIARDACVTELKALQGRLRATSTESRSRLSWQEMQNEIERHPEAYRRISENILSLSQFCGQHPELARSFAIGEETPAQFANQWIAWSKNLDPEYYRQSVSKLGKDRKRF